MAVSTTDGSPAVALAAAAEVPVPTITVKRLVPVPLPESAGFLTVMSRASAVALAAMSMTTVRLVALLRTTEVTVMPVPENVTSPGAQEPVLKSVPWMSTLRAVAPWTPMFGIGAKVRVGPTLTVNTPVPVPEPVSGLVTVTSRAPTVAPAAIEMFAVRLVALVKLVELTVMPVPENAAVAPVTKPVPVIVMSWLRAPWPRELGVVDVTVGCEMTVTTGECAIAVKVPPDLTA